MRAGLMTFLVAIAVGGLPAASAQDTSLDVPRHDNTAPRKGWHRIEARLTNRKGDVTARRGYDRGGP